MDSMKILEILVMKHQWILMRKDLEQKVVMISAHHHLEVDTVEEAVHAAAKYHPDIKQK